MRSDSAAAALDLSESVKLKLIPRPAQDVDRISTRKSALRIDGLIALAEIGRETGARC
jgi:hypothetical protein